MNEKLRKIINHYGVKKQLKYFQKEVFELTEAIVQRYSTSTFDNMLDSVIKVCCSLTLTPYNDRGKEHIAEEIADVMVMLKQFQLHYNIPTEDIKKIMKEKIDRQLDRIAKEDKNV